MGQYHCKPLYEGEAFSEWMGGLLEAKGARTFGDLARREDVELTYRYKGRLSSRTRPSDAFQACPATRSSSASRIQTTLAWPWPVRMSIPIFFEPVRFANPQTSREYLIVDGGRLSNFPV
jgi:NTE family protein